MRGPTFPYQAPDPSYLPERLAYWQHRLRLDNWRIEAKFVDRNTLEDEVSAMVKTHRWARMATVLLSQPGQEVSDDAATSCNWEHNLVHELIHLVLDDLCTQRGAPEGLFGAMLE
ncbi:MAG: hypothetical protein ACREJW_05865, partial [Candidatus Methylomirabilales bacterium]